MTQQSAIEIEIAKRAIVTSVGAQNSIIRRTATAGVREYEPGALSAALAWIAGPLLDTALCAGEIWVRGNAAATVIGGAGVYVQYTGFANNGLASNTTPDHANDHIEIDVAGNYVCLGSFHVESVGGGAADNVSLEIRKNNGTVIFNNLHSHRLLAGGGGDIGSMSVSGGLSSLAIDDTIELWLTNEDNATNILVSDANILIVRIGA
jgi:hypothetical protein